MTVIHSIWSILAFNVNNHHTNYFCPWYNSDDRESVIWGLQQAIVKTDNAANEQKAY